LTCTTVARRRVVPNRAVIPALLGIPALQFPAVVHKPSAAEPVHSVDAASATVSVIAVFPASFANV
jgi:hypothetical protein